MAPISRPGSSQYYVTPSYHRQRRLSEIPRRFDGGDVSSSDVSSRNYIDPWDLENYAYMERHYTDEYAATPTPALESSQSDFYYVPHYPPTSPTLRDESIGLFAGVEEEDFYNERYGTASPVNDCYQSYADVAVSRYKPIRADSYEDDSITSYSDDYRTEFINPRLNYELYSPSVMLRKPLNPNESTESTSLVYVYEAGSRKRKMALPKGNFRFERRRSIRGSFRSRRQMSDDCCPTDFSDDLSIDESSIANYEDFGHGRPGYNEEEEIYSSRPVPKYQLSKYGHLKIDYSFSWNSLGRYIGSD